MQHFNSESGMHIIRQIYSSCIAYLEAGQRFYFSVAASEKEHWTIMVKTSTNA